jgi:hypothetical protein
MFLINGYLTKLERISMKKLLFTLFLMTATAIAFAQTINLGIKAGLNLSGLSNSNIAGPDNSLLPGFNAGVIADIGFQNFSIQPGVFYSTKGEKIILQLVYANQQNAGTSNSNFELNYVEVPVNFFYKIPLAHQLMMHLGGGPYFGYGVSESMTANITPNNGSLPSSDNNSKFTNKNPDYGLNFIAGLEIKSKFIIDAGYGLGLANIGYYGEIKNRVLSISIGYLFR